MYVQSDTLLLTDASKTFRNMCLKIYELDPAKSISPPELARVKVELDFCTDIKMLLMVEKGIRGGYVTLFIKT